MVHALKAAVFGLNDLCDLAATEAGDPSLEGSPDAHATAARSLDRIAGRGLAHRARARPLARGLSRPGPRHERRVLRFRGTTAPAGCASCGASSRPPTPPATALEDRHDPSLDRLRRRRHARGPGAPPRGPRRPRRVGGHAPRARSAPARFHTAQRIRGGSLLRQGPLHRARRADACSTCSTARVPSTS